MARSQDVIFGINAVMEALNSGATLESIQVATGMNVSTRREIERLARAHNVRVFKTPKKELDRLSRDGAHQGVVAIWGAPAPLELDELSSLKPSVGKRTMLVCLDEVQDPHNLGALARSALAFGATGIVVPSRRSASNSPGALKASAGALCHLPLARVKNLGRALDNLKKMGFWICGAVSDGGKAPWDFDPGEKIALVLGSEGKGLRRSIEEKLDFKVKIPMNPVSESLNVSVAGAVLMYEWLGRVGAH